MPLSTFDMSMKPEPHPARPQNARGCGLSHALETPPSRRVSSHIQFLIVRVVLLLLLAPSPTRLPLHCCCPGFLSVSFSPSHDRSVQASNTHNGERFHHVQESIASNTAMENPSSFQCGGRFGFHFLDPGTGG